MEKVIQLHRKIAPELIAVVEERYEILRYIWHAGPLGRRALAGMLGIGERIVRKQVDFLKEAGLIEFSLLGMKVTADGHALLDDLAEYVHLLHGLTALEQELAHKLGIKRVVIIPGDSSEADGMTQRELGRAAAGVLSQYLGNNMTIAVSGGSTMCRVAEAINITQPTATVISARGGLGELVEYQANTIAALMANKLGGNYRLLHIPEGVSEEVVEAIMASDTTLPILTEMIRKADILVHSIGQAREMAVRRRLDDSIVNEILSRGAVGEALGHYCTMQGKPVYVTNSVGLRLDDLADIGVVIAVAGGRKKAEAIVALTSAVGQDVLITDEAAARAIQSIIKSGEFQKT
ncbi:MAG: DNA-binding transcriptional regulator [Pelosinus sp.]|nr:DNA-binding transcriptional regulator [Pelosinus sp.]